MGYFCSDVIAFVFESNNSEINFVYFFNLMYIFLFEYRATMILKCCIINYFHSPLLENLYILEISFTSNPPPQTELQYIKSMDRLGHDKNLISVLIGKHA